MKLAVSIMKVVQTGGIFGSFWVTVVSLQFQRDRESWVFGWIFLGFGALAFGSTLGLALNGERWRAWVGAMLLVVLFGFPVVMLMYG